MNRRILGKNYETTHESGRRGPLIDFAMSSPRPPVGVATTEDPGSGHRRGIYGDGKKSKTKTISNKSNLLQEILHHAPSFELILYNLG